MSRSDEAARNGLRICGACSVAVPIGADPCPKCGVSKGVGEQVARTRASASVAGATPSVWTGEAIGGCVVMISIVALVFGMCFLPKDPAVEAAEKTRRENSNVDANLEVQSKQQLKARMKDPDAVQFRSIRVKREAGSVFLCGEYNAKNGFGAYNGFKPFLGNGSVVVTGEDATGGARQVITALLAKCS